MRWFRSDTAKVLLIVALLFVALEGIVRGFDLRAQLTDQPNEIAVSDYSLEAIYGADWRDYRIVGREQSTSAVYSPFVEYISGEVNGRFVTVTSDGVRCHDSTRKGCAVKGGKDEVWVFGGSTTFGYGVKNDETIPAYLDDLLTSYRVLNFGVASYYSTIERIEFLNLLTRFPPPAAVVFIDGLNDFYYHQIPDISMVSDELRNVFALPDSARTMAKLSAVLRKSELISLAVDVMAEPGQKTPVLQRSDAALKKVIRRMRINMDIRTAAAERLGVQVVNVLQPVPLFGAGHATSLIPADFLNFEDHVNSKRGYEMIEADPALLADPSLLNLARLQTQGQMYVDTVHYHPDFNRLIAERIFQKLRLD